MLIHDPCFTWVCLWLTRYTLSDPHFAINRRGGDYCYNHLPLLCRRYLPCWDVSHQLWVTSQPSLLIWVPCRNVSRPPRKVQSPLCRWSLLSCNSNLLMWPPIGHLCTCWWSYWSSSCYHICSFGCYDSFITSHIRIGYLPSCGSSWFNVTYHGPQCCWARTLQCCQRGTKSVAGRIWGVIYLQTSDSRTELETAFSSKSRHHQSLSMLETPLLSRNCWYKFSLQL